jgi:hypothetical protein
MLHFYVRVQVHQERTVPQCCGTSYREKSISTHPPSRNMVTGTHSCIRQVCHCGGTRIHLRENRKRYSILWLILWSSKALSSPMPTPDPYLSTYPCFPEMGWLRYLGILSSLLCRSSMGPHSCPWCPSAYPISSRCLPPHHICSSQNISRLFTSSSPQVRPEA